MNADEIIVLDQGRIIERGSHAELLAGRRLRPDVGPAAEERETEEEAA
jgi:ATP-binding cassette subfamily B protein